MQSSLSSRRAPCSPHGSQDALSEMRNDVPRPSAGQRRGRVARRRPTENRALASREPEAAGFGLDRSSSCGPCPPTRSAGGATAAVAGTQSVRRNGARSTGGAGAYSVQAGRGERSTEAASKRDPAGTRLWRDRSANAVAGVAGSSEAISRDRRARRSGSAGDPVGRAPGDIWGGASGSVHRRASLAEGIRFED